MISVTERSNEWRAEKGCRMGFTDDSDKSSFTKQGALPLRVTTSHCPDILLVLFCIKLLYFYFSLNGCINISIVLYNGLPWWLRQ